MFQNEAYVAAYVVRTMDHTAYVICDTLCGWTTYAANMQPHMQQVATYVTAYATIFIFTFFRQMIIRTHMTILIQLRLIIMHINVINSHKYNLTILLFILIGAILNISNIMFINIGEYSFRC